MDAFPFEWRKAIFFGFSTSSTEVSLSNSYVCAVRHLNAPRAHLENGGFARTNDLIITFGTNNGLEMNLINRKRRFGRALQLPEPLKASTTAVTTNNTQQNNEHTHIHTPRMREKE